MTADPKRWLEEDEGAAIAAFVGALRSDEPSDEMREALWSKIAPIVPGGGGSGSGSGSGSGGGSVLGAKAIGLGVAGIGIVTIVAWMATRPAPAVEAPLPTPVASTIAAPVPSETASAIEPVVVEPVASASASVARPQTRVVPSAPVKPSPSTSTSTSVDRLREEAEGVRRARQLLRDKNPGAALAELDRLGKLIPAGPLAEEREVLTIEAMAASGDKEGARRRAERFLFERPNSVHASRVRAFTER